MGQGSVNIHFGKRTSNMTDAEIELVAKHGNLIALEKGHGASAHGSIEAGSTKTARLIKPKGPEVKVLFYLNSFHQLAWL